MNPKPAYWNVYFSVSHLLDHAKWRHARNTIGRPPGWELMNLPLQRAIQSGEAAMSGEPNYSRLTLAEGELKQVTSPSDDQRHLV